MNSTLSTQIRRWLALLSLVVCMSIEMHAETVEIDGLYYSLNSDGLTASVTYENTSADNYSSLPADVVIPSSVSYNNETYEVTEIANKAFANCTNLQSISIPGTVINVGTSVTYSGAWSDSSYYHKDAGKSLPFYNCTNLKSVRFEDGSDSISIAYNMAYDQYNDYSADTKQAFYYCKLEELYIGRNIVADKGDVKLHKYSPFYLQSNLTKVTVGTLVTEIPPYLFYYNSSIPQLNLPHVKTIGESAFQYCSKLTAVNLGDAIESVGDNAFASCHNVTKLTFPNTLQTIGASAFSNCTSVTEVTVGSGLRSIGNSAFYGCESFTAIILPNEFQSMGASAFEGCKKLTIAQLGESITSIPTAAFKDCVALSEMNLPATVKSIGGEAFYNDSGLATITLNEGLETIGYSAFHNNSGILRFIIPGTVTSIGSNCFYGCTSVTYLIFRDGDAPLKIDNSNCRSSIISDQVPGVTNVAYKQYIYNRYYDYFYDCPIKYLTLGRNLEYSYNSNQEIYDIYGTTANKVTRASAPFVNKNTLVSVTIGSKVTFLHNHLFDGCRNITKLTISGGMQEIRSYALANCTGLTDLSFPNSLVLFDNNACYYNANLKSIKFNEESGSNLELVIGNYALAKCGKLESLVIPSKTIKIGDSCFDDDSSLSDITFTDGYKELSIGRSVDYYGVKPIFNESKLNKLYLGRNLKYVLSNDNPKFSPFYNQSELTDITISQSGTVTTLSDYLFKGVSSCESLLLPESLTSIGKYAFSDMRALKAINIPSKIDRIKEGLFENCNSLGSIVVHPAVNKIDSYVFKNCKSLTAVSFEGSEDLLTIGSGASDASYGLFRDCPIETLDLDRWLSYTTSPFSSIATLKNLNIGKNVGVIDKYMFSYCTGLEEVYLPDNIESVGLSAFRGCTSLAKVRLSEKLTQVADYGFSECTSLDNVVFPASMTSVSDHSFSDCTSLRKLDLGNKLLIIGPAAFKNDIALEAIEIPTSLYGLGVEAFANCTSLPYVEIRAISSVGKQAFQGCTGLNWISLSDKTTSLGENSFAGCTNIAYVKSYAEFPPEGLVNFPDEVVKAGTLFVPEYSVDYYRDSPTWENWFKILPLMSETLVSWIKLDKSEVTLRMSEKALLVATVGEDDAACKDLIWVSSNEEVATVDESGLVTPVSIGECVITVSAADGSGIKATCSVNVVPTRIELDKSEVSLKVAEKSQLVATVEEDDMSGKDVTWSSSNEDVATVDESGLITAVSIGQCIITALVTDGSGSKATCNVKVVPTMVESIEIHSPSQYLAISVSRKLSATVYPEDATDKTFTWSISDSSIATISEDGVVYGKQVGYVDVKATANDGSGVEATFSLDIIRGYKGDSNFNNVVTVADAIYTADYALHSDDYSDTAHWNNFNRDAADMNYDGYITLLDADRTIDSVLLNSIEIYPNGEIFKKEAEAPDMLVVDDVETKEGETALINVRLNNSQDYVAFQTDIKVPEGMTIEDLNMGTRVVNQNQFEMHRIDDRTVRAVVYNFDLNKFSNSEDPVLELKVSGDKESRGVIELKNTIAADAMGQDHILASTGGNILIASSIDILDNNKDVRVEATCDGINIINAEGCSVAICSIDGAVISNFEAASDFENCKLIGGIYVVIVNDKAIKIMIK